MNTKKIVQIYEEEGGDVLRFIDENGNSTNYNKLSSFSFKREIKFNVDSLEVHESGSVYLHVSEGGHQAPPSAPERQDLLKTERYIKGFATLNKRGSYSGKNVLSVIGDSENSISRISLFIRRLDCIPITKDKAAAYYSKNPSVTLYGYDFDSFLGFYPEGGWYLDISLADEILKNLIDAIFNKRLKSLELSIYFRDIYTDVGEYYSLPDGYEKYEEEPNYYLRPNIEDGEVSHPETAHGLVTHWNMEFSNSFQFSDSNDLMSLKDSTVEAPKASENERMFEEIKRMIGEVGSLRTTVIVLGWILIAISLLSIVIRR